MPIFRQQRLDHVDQRVGRNKGFLQDAVGAHPLRLLFVEGIERANQQHHRRVHIARIALNEFTNFVAVAYGHEDVCKDQIGAEVRNFTHGRFAIANCHDIDAFVLQGQGNHLLDVAIVVGHEYARHRGLLRASTSSRTVSSDRRYALAWVIGAPARK